MIDFINWREVKQSGESDLPEIHPGFITSPPVLFMADGKLCAGHLHSNGWFYNEVDGSGPFMARGKFGATRAHEFEHVWCEKWCYMNNAS